MSIADSIYKLRSKAGLSQEKFAEVLGVSRQAVQKWETGAAQPDLKKVVAAAKYFGVSLDALLMDRSVRSMEDLRVRREVTPDYQSFAWWEAYFGELDTEYRQSIEEGLDIEKYRGLFESVSKLENGKYKKELADVLFEIVLNAPMRAGYAYNEPSALEDIRALRRPHEFSRSVPSRERLADKLRGAWLGRVCGCMLGKTVEGIWTDELTALLKASGNWPMHRYILSADPTQEMLKSFRFSFRDRCFADTIDGMPSDDDTNYTVMAYKLIERCGRDFTPGDVAAMWIASQPKGAYCTAERVAFCNFIKGYAPPDSAIYKNPYREWIGAQIRADYYGYINPGDPEAAAEMAWRDASISHVKNGIYGEMFVAAMLACAAVTDDIRDIILGGLAEIPATSRLYERVTRQLRRFDEGVSESECFDDIRSRYDETVSHDWCHTISNAEIVTASLLYGGGDYGRSICRAVQTGFDTDCNGATVGSILGMRSGAGCIGREWSDPVGDRLHTDIFGLESVKISEMAAKTLEHVRM